MRLYLFILIIFFIPGFSNNLYAQCWSPGPFPAVLDSFYTRINNAELFIANQNIPAAIISYRKASEFKSLDYIDRLNLLQCYLETQKITEAVSVIIQMAEDHYGLVFLNDEKYIDVINDENWIYYVEHNYKPPPEYPIRKLLIETHNEYQFINKTQNEDSIQLILHDISIKMKRMVINGEYPSEQSLGYGGSRYQLSTHGMVFMFFTALKDSTFNADSVLTALLFEGKMSPEQLTAYNIYLGKRGCGCDPFRDAIYFEFENKLYTCNKAKEIIVDQCRKSMMLPSLDDPKKIIDFQEQNPLYRFRACYNTINGDFKTNDPNATFDLKNYEDQLEFVKTIKHDEDMYFVK